METIKSGIYCIRNLVNNKRYVGSSVNLKNRKDNHFFQLRRGIHTNSHLQNAFVLYGEENFIFEILEYIEDINILLEKENLWMAFYNSTNMEFGYNARKDASNNLGVRYSEEVKKKMSENHWDNSGQNHPLYGKKHSKETKQKMSESQSKRVRTSPNPNFQKHPSEETRKKLSAATSGEKQPFCQNNQRTSKRNKKDDRFGI